MLVHGLPGVSLRSFPLASPLPDAGCRRPAPPKLRPLAAVTACPAAPTPRTTVAPCAPRAAPLTATGRALAVLWPRLARARAPAYLLLLLANCCCSTYCCCFRCLVAAVARCCCACLQTATVRRCRLTLPPLLRPSMAERCVSVCIVCAYGVCT